MILKQDNMKGLILKKKIFCSKGKNNFDILKNFSFLTNTLAKLSKTIFAYSFVSEHSMHFFFILRKNLHFLEKGGGAGSSTPPPLFDASEWMQFFVWACSLFADSTKLKKLQIRNMLEKKEQKNYSFQVFLLCFILLWY